VTRNDELVFPNKLFEYLMAGLAVAVPRLPGMAPLVEGERIGVTYEPERPDLLADALRRLDGDREELENFRIRAHRLALDRLNAAVAAEVLVSVWTGASLRTSA
jgi:glycosyltransferase involved in cell wall biosynthesis